MKPAITELVEAVEKTIQELIVAISLAEYCSDRMAVRNLDLRLATMNQLLREVKAHEEYITQPRFEKYIPKP